MPRGIYKHSKLSMSTIEKLKQIKRKPIQYIIDENGCWICTSHSKDKDGYIAMWHSSRYVRGHRYMYEQKYGKIPEGKCACHKCDNPSCINPDHIFLGTLKDNTVDMVLKGRKCDKRGEMHHMHKLTNDQVVSIRIDTRLHKEIACNYGVSRSAITNIKLRKNWNHIK